jgi:putative DNA primase/helicase
MTIRWFDWKDAPATGDAADWTGSNDELRARLEAAPIYSSDRLTGPIGVREREGHHDSHQGSTSFFTEEGFVPARLGEHLIAEASIRLGRDRRLWRYALGVYRPDGDDWARQRVRELVGERFRRRHLDEVCAYLRARLPSLGDEPPERSSINCRNGLLDWRSGELKPHSPNVVSINQLPVAWQPQAACPAIMRFLAETIPWDALDLIEELFGYALYPANPYRKAVMLLGPGGNGKSTLLGLFRGLLGNANVAAVSLQQLGEDRFAAADLFGKLANICGDLRRSRRPGGRAHGPVQTDDRRRSHPCRVQVPRRLRLHLWGTTLVQRE